MEEIRARIQKTKERQHQLEQELHGSAPAPDPRSPAEPEPAPKLRHPEPEEGAPGEESYLQFGVFSSEANAAVLVRRLRSAGFRANLETLHQPTGIAYQVRGGDYPSRDQARAAAVRFREAGFPTQLKSGGH